LWLVFDNDPYFMSLSTRSVREQESVELKWFKPNDALVKLRQENSTKLVYVFLEGPTGAGKTEVLTKLNKMGYSTRDVPFLPLAASHKSHLGLASLDWLGSFIRSVERVQQEFKV
jgi:hypothetical protein